MAGNKQKKLGLKSIPVFAATEILFHEDGAVKGVATGDMGSPKGTPGPNFAAGMELHARQTVFAEGCRGHLGQLMAHFSLNKNVQPQTYAIGLKELGNFPKMPCRNSDPYCGLAIEIRYVWWFFLSFGK